MNLKPALIAAAMCLGCAAGHAQWARPAAASGSGVVASARSADDQKLFAQALRLYRSGRWSAAYGRFVVLADRGDVPAARIALQMLRHGSDLYGTEWTAAPTQVAGWERVAAATPAFKVAVLGE